MKHLFDHNTKKCIIEAQTCRKFNTRLNEKELNLSVKIWKAIAIGLKAVEGL